MASTTEPLLNTPQKSKFICKFLYTALAFVALLVSAVFLASNLSKQTQNDVSHICQRALHPETCQDFVSQVVSSAIFETKDTTVILQKLLMKEAHLMKNASFHARNLRNQMNEKTEQGAMSDCIELLDMSFDRVLDSVKAIRDGTRMSRADARTWLSGVLTNHVTCFDGLQNSSRKSMETFLEDLILRARASLAILATVSEPETDFAVLSALGGMLLPPWITAMDKTLLETSGNAIKADITVAADGSGNYKTVAEAVKAAPTNSKTRYVIYVKKGTYKENVEVASNKKNLMIVGDGMDSTTITGDLSVGGGSTTFNSATLAAVGDGFILQDIGIKNTAGAAMNQAVALRLGADKSVINRCRLDAFQDTLYAHSQRQFYKQCYITGTVDFIFGNSAVVFQKCKLAARKPMAKQQNMVTAQGRTDPNQNTATSIQGCDIIASSDLEPVQSSFRTYLGRPWKEYSRTVVMQSNISSVIDPAGWAKWSGDFALDTLYYGEYQNEGAGAGTSKRVDWPGYHVITKSSDAMKFTVKELIQGGDWLGSTGVSYTEGLM
ncbi:pectinesterase-like [Primulina huaijiensis]|uniref:pectinesterase-like n=1 Tax=Primulina huaijiensis TaxID=1492673 RepID=UPI003CC777B3